MGPYMGSLAPGGRWHGASLSIRTLGVSEFVLKESEFPESTRCLQPKQQQEGHHLNKTGNKKQQHRPKKSHKL